jgi:hypothetical protein
MAVVGVDTADSTVGVMLAVVQACMSWTLGQLDDPAHQLLANTQ